ncbi:Hypothetical predicted protein [Octopus vulgaris]|uniref:Uncharacterized protein n=1 Tax=Octopus vulgaris TaxID=6645 RepID=A0AA36F6P7_OCTVU|nr:Hypothetical predicted protein [Octopus vulgaris]
MACEKSERWTTRSGEEEKKKMQLVLEESIAVVVLNATTAVIKYIPNNFCDYPAIQSIPNSDHICTCGYLADHFTNTR